MAYTIGVDLGGTKVETALVDADGRALASERRPTDPAQGPDGVVADLVACIESVVRAAGWKQVAGVAVGVAGQVDPATGRVAYAPNLGWQDYPLGDRLAELLGREVAVINDVQAATYGEWIHGAGRGVGELACLFVGTGIGGGLVSGNRLLLGCTGSAGELGHMTIQHGGPLCRCGKRGCLEAFAGGWAIGRRAREAVAADPAAGAALLRLAGGDPARVTARVVARAAEQGDPLACQIVEEVGVALAAGAGSLANALNPCLLIVGGGVIAGMPRLVEIVRREIPRHSLQAPLRGLKIVTAALGPHAGSVGAAAWARQAQLQ